jgi:hypothetical protein
MSGKPAARPAPIHSAFIIPHSSFGVARALVLARRDAALERVPGAAIRAQFLAGFFDRKKNPRVGVPQHHGRHRAVQRKIGRVHLDMPFPVLCLLHDEAVPEAESSRRYTQINADEIPETEKHIRQDLHDLQDQIEQQPR